MDLTPPTREEYRRLYEAAIALKGEAPWEWMFEDEIFGVCNPETGQIGYVSIMGANGEHLALALYLGSEGLDGFWRLSQGEGMENIALFLEVPELQASFEDRTELDKDDRAVLKDLGLKFRGRQAWPLFRSYVPGCAPWFLTSEEVRFLAVAIEQALEVIPRLEEDPELLEAEEEDEYLVRVKTEDGWEDQWLTPKPVPMRPPPAVNTKLLAELRQELPRHAFTLEVDLAPLPTYVMDEDDPRPYLPYSLMVVDATSGMILGTELMVARPTLDAVWEKAVEKFLDILRRLEVLPQELGVRDDRLYSLLVPVAAGLGIRLQISRSLPALDEAREAMNRIWE